MCDQGAVPRHYSSMRPVLMAARWRCSVCDVADTLISVSAKSLIHNFPEISIGWGQQSISLQIEGGLTSLCGIWFGGHSLPLLLGYSTYVLLPFLHRGGETSAGGKQGWMQDFHIVGGDTSHTHTHTHRGVWVWFYRSHACLI